MLKKHLIILIFPFFLVINSFGSEDAYTTFVQANQFYKSTNYSKAIQLYKQAESLGFAPGGLYYNLGNAYYRAGDLGRAIAAYLKARQLLPRDSDVLENLNTARSQISDKIAVSSPPAALRQFLFIYYNFSVDELLWMTAITIAVFFVLLSIYAFWQNSIVKKITKFVVILLIIIGVTAAIKYYNFSKHSTAVIITKEALVRSGPDKSYAEIFVLHDGTEVKIIEKRDKAAKIKVDGKKGWVNLNDIEII